MSETIIIPADRSCITDDDAYLVQEAQRNPAAFEELYRKWLKPVYRYFYARLQNNKDAEDLTSQVFLKAYQSLPNFKNNGNFSAWLFKIAHDRAVDFYRKTKPLMSLDGSVSQLNNTSIEPEVGEHNILLQEVLQMVSTLPEDEQELIHLRFMAGLNYREIGLVLKKSEDAVRKSISRLIKRLQVQLEVDHE